ncbi:predicted protein [Nematostella vectensis]|uniref:Uncharacterized protein n=2 Tax=Nematostella vectensis TaxID=45351 RepID=A7RYH1_NEMVE|nr:predicted protein [Nematostella vectensis]|eukprot:XP_001635582.1 predicted protein [Nematostella vectensis]
MDPKVAVITGCSSGIGLATASILAKDGEKRFRVYATMRNLDKKGSLESACQNALGDTLFIRELDVSSDDSVEEALNAIYEEEGRIDILVNNAGISHIGMLETQTQSLVKETFNTNFFGVLRMSKAVIPRMKSDHSGHIINISSTAGHTGMPFTGLYCASKFAVEGLSESLAPLLRKFGVK